MRNMINGTNILILVHKLIIYNEHLLEETYFIIILMIMENICEQ